MKTTIEISDELLRRAKRAALERNTTLRVIVEEALARALGEGRTRAAPLRTVTWPPAGAVRNARLDARTVLDAIAREREHPADDAGYWSRRFPSIPSPAKKSRK